MAKSRKTPSIVTFKADESLLEALRGIENRSEFIRTALLAALENICPVCKGRRIKKTIGPPSLLITVWKNATTAMNSTWSAASRRAPASSTRAEWQTAADIGPYSGSHDEG